MCTSQRAICLGIAVLVALTGSALALASDEVRTNVTLTTTPYNPPITIPDAGGTFGYNIQVSNDESEPLTFDVWTTYTPAAGGATEPGYGPVELLLPAGWSAQQDLTQDISGGLPAGVYTYTAHAGVYPNQIWSSDGFEFEKLAGDVGWYPQSPGAENGLTGVSFVDANSGWAVSSYREIIHTTDGGDTWLQQDDGQTYGQRYNDVCFVNLQTGWVVGYGWSLGGTVLKTTDAGSTWIEQEPYYEYELNSVFFVDALNGWAAGGFVDIYGSNHRRIIEHTSDGGDTWQGQHSQSYRYPLRSVHFADASSGWAVGGPGYILHTSNGGGTWTERC